MTASKSRQIARCHDPAGGRTQNLTLKRRLLCQLSYRAVKYSVCKHRPAVSERVARRSYAKGSMVNLNPLGECCGWHYITGEMHVNKLGLGKFLCKLLTIHCHPFFDKYSGTRYNSRSRARIMPVLTLFIPTCLGGLYTEQDWRNVLWKQSP